MLWYIFGIITVLFFNGDPKKWPPLYYSPLRSTSLHEFWGMRWQQFWRPCFAASGGIPFRAFFRTISPSLAEPAYVFGTFLSSAVSHSWFFYSFPDPQLPGWPNYVWWLAQPFGLAMEKAWKRSTGTLVGGWLGWLWTVFWITVFGQICGEYERL